MDSSYTCAQCGMVTKSKVGLKLHMNRIHSGEDKIMPYLCSHCGRAFSSQSSLLKHMKIHGDRPYQCLQCGKAFSYNNELIAHLRNHTGEKAYQCKQCGVYFSDNTYLTRHTPCHRGVCNHCKKVFLDKNDFIKHMMVGTHSSEKQCGKCHVVFGCHSDRELHLECLKYEEESLVTQKNYKCRNCDEVFTYNTELEVHLMAHISPMDDKNPGKDFFPYKCGQSAKFFKIKTNYRDHMRAHSVEKPYQCTNCNESFLSKDKCITHMKVHGKNPYQCVPCGKAFSHKSNLIAHMKVHGKEPYQYIQCGEAFSYYSDLTVHRRSHISKVYPCKHCSLVFSDARYLERHMVGHTTEQEYNKKCEKLGLHTINPDLKSSSVSTGSTELPYQCKLCDMTYKTREGFITHITKHTSGLDKFDMPYKSMNATATNLGVPKDCANSRNSNAIMNSNYIYRIDHADETDAEIKEEQIDEGYKSHFDTDPEFREKEYNSNNIQNETFELKPKVEIKEEEIWS